MSTLGRFAHDAGEKFGAGLAAASVMLNSTVKPKERFTPEEPINLQTTTTTTTTTTSFSWDATQALKVTNGFFTGMVETQPYNSNSYRCKGNFTLGYDSGQRLYNDTKFFTTSWNTFQFQKNLMLDLSYVMKIPFGIPYSCYGSYEDIMVDKDPYEDGVLTIDEALEQRVVISNRYLTNIFFNAGYMYQDAKSLLNLLNTDKDYATNLGIYSGDLFIRIFWRRRFTRNFSYIPGNPMAPDPYTTTTQKTDNFNIP